VPVRPPVRETTAIVKVVILRNKECIKKSSLFFSFPVSLKFYWLILLSIEYGAIGAGLTTVPCECWRNRPSLVPLLPRNSSLTLQRLSVHCCILLKKFRSHRFIPIR
jgi:hypothetical protein